MHHHWRARLVWVTLLLLLAVDSVSPQIFDQDIPIAGIASVRAVGHAPSRASSALSSSTGEFYDDGSSSSSTSNSNSGASAITTEEELVDALEVDTQVTVVGEVQVGELACNSLVGAENASWLQVALSADEVVLAERSSYTVVSGDAFTDGLWRHVWTGLVNESANAGNESFARSVSMTWGHVCDVETFLLKVITHHTNGNTSMVKSIPCAVSGTTICVVEVDLVFFDEQAPLTSPFNVSANGTFPGRRRLRDETDRGERRIRNGDYLSGARGDLGRRRQLQSSSNSTQIDIMILYTDLALVQLGDVSAAQMESTIIEGFVTTNAAFENSEVSIEFSLVYVGQLPYDQDPDMSSYEVLYDLLDNDEVADLRDAYGADLVQLVAAFTDVCGLGYLYNTYWGAELGFSVVAPGCIEYDSHTHEFGHNMGCDHDLDSATTVTEYAYGWRYCDGTDPYRTVMSYWCGSSRANYFSNPNVSYLDKPTGTASADNVRVLEDNMVAVSNFRDTVTLAPSLTPAPNTYNPGPPSTPGILTFMTPSPTPGPWAAPSSGAAGRAVHTERTRWGSVVVVSLTSIIVAASCAALL